MSRAVEVVVSQRQRGLLEKLVRNRADTSYRLIERCRIVLMSADGVANVEQGRRLNADQQLGRRWRRRWLERCARRRNGPAIIGAPGPESGSGDRIEGPLDCPETLIPYTFPTSFGLLPTVKATS